MHQRYRQRGRRHDRDAAHPRHGTGMNLPAAWGVYQSKPRRAPSNHRGQQHGQDGTTHAEQQVNSQCEPPLS